MSLALLFEHDLIRRPVSLRKIGAWGYAFRDLALMRGSSLATRLFLSATAWVVVILVIILLAFIVHWAGGGALNLRLGHFVLNVGFT